MASFALYFPNLLRNEGGYCHYPLTVDPGGETYRGISRVYHATWPGWPVIDASKLQHGLPAPVPQSAWPQLNAVLETDGSLNSSVASFYQAFYWDPLRLTEVVSQSVADQLADQGVNTGLSRPAKMMQYLLNTEFGARLAVDGEVGPATIAALNQVVPSLFFQSFVEMRQAFYYYRAGSSNTSTPNMAGWCEFFSNTLGLRPDAQMRRYLGAWLARTETPFS